jgi:DNA-binding transcriptional ArsR family regulator
MTPDKATAISSDTCEVVSVDEGRVRLALKTMPTDRVVNALAETFRSLSDPTRVRMLSALSTQELCVCELASVLGLTGSAVSHQLRLLRGAGLVRYRKEGKMAHYTLDDEHIGSLLEEGLRHVRAG